MPSKKALQDSAKTQAMQSQYIAHRDPVRAKCGHKAHQIHRTTGLCMECHLQHCKLCKRPDPSR